MSDLNRLKQQIDGVSKSARKTASSLNAFDREFRKHTAEVQRAMGGSSQRKDAEVVNALQAAAKAVQQAGQALENASRIASRYGQSL